MKDIISTTISPPRPTYKFPQDYSVLHFDLKFYHCYRVALLLSANHTKYINKYKVVLCSHKISCSKKSLFKEWTLSGLKELLIDHKHCSQTYKFCYSHSMTSRLISQVRGGQSDNIYHETVEIYLTANQ